MANGQSLYQVVNGVDPLAPLPAPEQPKMGRGQLIAGILADMLAGAMGRPGQFAQHLDQQRQQEQEDVRWGRRLEQEQQIKARYPDVSPMARDLAVWQQMTPEQRTAYQQMKASGAPDPDIYTTLPNGQFYAGPRSGLAAALGGYQAPPATSGTGNPDATPTTEDGFSYTPGPGGRANQQNWKPIGGPTQPASGGFPRY